MRVRLLADWLDTTVSSRPPQPFHLAGTILEMDEATARSLFHGGLAEPMDAPRPAERAVAPPKATRKRK